jgi:hypothetical protein
MRMRRIERRWKKEGGYLGLFMKRKKKVLGGSGWVREDGEKDTRPAWWASLSSSNSDGMLAP